MTNWNHNRGGSLLVNDEDGYGGFNVSCGANDTKTSWAEQIASTSQDYYGFYFGYRVSSYASYTYTMDIGIGGSGSEVALVEEFCLPYLYASSRYGCGSSPIYFPLFIPAGSRLSTRGRTSAGSTYTSYGTFFGVANAPFTPLFGKSEYFNVDTTVSFARSQDPGAVADTWGSYADLQDGTLDFDAKWLLWFQGAYDNTRPSGSTRTQLAVGASGSEVVIGERTSYSHTSGDFQSEPYVWFPVDIPANTTLRHRTMSQSTVSGDRHMWLAYYFFG